MDDLAHEPLNVNHRKRKADSDDSKDSANCTDSNRQVSPEVIRVDTTVASASTNAPRQPWLAPDSDNPMWPSPTSPQVSSPLSSQVFNSYPDKPTKRPRITPPSPAGKRLLKKSLAKPIPSRPPTIRHGNDIEDIGIVSTADPGPSSGSLLHLRESSLTHATDDVLPAPIPIDLSSTHIPPLQPLINRQTLKELDLDAILRNPQLRTSLGILVPRPKPPSLTRPFQATISYLILDSSSDPRQVGASVTWPKNIGLLSHRNSKMDAHVFPLTWRESHSRPCVHVRKFHCHQQILLSLYLQPLTSLLSACRQDSVISFQSSWRSCFWLYNHCPVYLACT